MVFPLAMCTEVVDHLLDVVDCRLILHRLALAGYSDILLGILISRLFRLVANTATSCELNAGATEGITEP